MSPELLYAIGTAATWTGWIALLRAAYLACRLLTKSPGMSVEGTRRGLAFSALVAGIALLLGGTLPMDLGRPQTPAAFHWPVVWFAMGAYAWLGALSVVMALIRAGQAWLALTRDETKARLSAATIWGAAGVVFLGLQVNSAEPVTILRGQIPLSATTAVALVLLALGAIFAMGIAAGAVRARGISIAIVTHMALLVGCLVFGIPFAWLLVTSFKEDRDLAAIDGIVWVPRVSERVPYLNPERPRYAALDKDTSVEAEKLTELPGGKWLMEIQSPLNRVGATFEADPQSLKVVPKMVPVVTGTFEGKSIRGMVVEELDGGDRRVQIQSPPEVKGVEFVANSEDVDAVRHVGLNFKNYPDALLYLPPETQMGLVYLKNTLILVFFSVFGTLLSCSIVAYAFSRMRFPGKGVMFAVLLSTMMLPGAVTLLPTFLIFRQLGWIDTLYPLWVPTFFAGAFNVFLLRQFFMSIPMELEDAAKIDGCSFLRTFWQVMVPQIKPALAVIAIWTFMGAWNNFMGPLIYVNSPENMPIAYAVQLFQGQRGGEQHLMMAFATMAMLPVLVLFFFAQKYFIEGVTLSGFGGR
ncbi:MAG TPA: carbohydrate ABC transporter permease [Fimbriimonadaceae bacterium]|nr:carbohydrate ABC transporter permease [Fimbriimonadaceae bacterium]HRJ97014.1 carbohydrate ABC transporter permease [Fimbriimonadaceae bacterium]